MSDRSLVVSFGSVMASANFMIIICDNPYHVHHSPIQELTAVEYRGHHVAVTKDGSFYSVRIDKKPQTDKHNLTEDEAIDYVESNTQMEVNDVW